MRIFFTLLLLTYSITSLSQGNADYYNPAFSNPFNRKPYSTESLRQKLEDPEIHNRWYLGIDGFLQTDKNTLSNDFDGLISTASPASYNWSVVAGWIKDENWGIEAEYARSPIHNVLQFSGDNLLQYKFTNDKNSVILRGKRRLLFGKASHRRSAFWLGGGVGLVPNSGKQKDYIEFYGYRSRGRRQGVDTLAIISDTRTSNAITGIAEASAEYVLKVAKSVDLSFFTRKQWGFGNSLTTSLAYFVNGQQTQTALISGDGSGWKFGISLRYVFQIGYDSQNIGRRLGTE